MVCQRGVGLVARMSRLEKRIVRQVMAYLRARGFWCCKLWGQMAGMPDVIAIKNGRAYWFEVKGERGRVSPIQEHMLGTLRSYGCVAQVVRSVADVENAVSARDQAAD